MLAAQQIWHKQHKFHVLITRLLACQTKLVSPQSPGRHCMGMSNCTACHHSAISSSVMEDVFRGEQLAM